VFVAVFALFSPLDKIVELTNIGTLFAFVLVCAGVMILRHTDPHRARPFKTPWIPLLPIWLVILWYLPREIVQEDWGKVAEHLVVLLLAIVGTLFSGIGIWAKLTGRRVPEIVKTEFALAGIGSCVWLMAGLPALTWWRFAGWLAIGLTIYTLYGYRHSRMGDHVPPLSPHLRLITPGAFAGAFVAWWISPYPWSLVLPILILLGLSAYALHTTQRRAA
jgi:amino acid transporter